jgi:hypothetical protein
MPHAARRWSSCLVNTSHSAHGSPILVGVSMNSSGSATKQDRSTPAAPAYSSGAATSSQPLQDTYFR